MFNLKSQRNSGPWLCDYWTLGPRVKITTDLIISDISSICNWLYLYLIYLQSAERRRKKSLTLLWVPLSTIQGFVQLESMAQVIITNFYKIYQLKLQTWSLYQNVGVSYLSLSLYLFLSLVHPLILVMHRNRVDHWSFRDQCGCSESRRLVCWRLIKGWHGGCSRAKAADKCKYKF